MRQLHRLGVIAGAGVVALAVMLATMYFTIEADQLSGEMPEELASRRAEITEILRSGRTPWAKATAVNAIVKEETPPIYSGYFCNDYASWYIGLASTGLKTRMVTGRLNLLNNFDTHTTVEVWLPKKRRWVIVDPTFGGHFEADGEPLGAHDLQRLILAHESHRVRWVSSHVENSARPSEYYADPMLLFRHVFLWSPGYAESATSVRAVRGRPVGDPPWYAGRRVTQAHTGAVVLVGRRPFSYRGRPADPSEGRWLTPVVGIEGVFPAGVRAYAVPRFPTGRES